MEKLEYCKIRNVKSPCRAHPTDAGIDFFVPDDISYDLFKEKCDITKNYPLCKLNDKNCIETIILKPGQSVLIPSGIKVKVPDGYALIYTNKSGVASKKHLLVGANTVDIGYSGECHINVHNVGTSDQEIHAGDKLVQGILFKLGFHEPAEIENESLLYKDEISARGSGGFGSSGEK